jgi:hypothetical protein
MKRTKTRARTIPPKLTNKKGKAGQPSSYDPDMHPELAEKLCEEFGAQHSGLAKVFDVSVTTIATWMREHPEFREAVRRGKDNFDTEKVEASLLQRALGYEIKEILLDKKTGHPILDSKGQHIYIIKIIPPSDTAIIFYLKNRQPQRWRDVQEKYLKGDIRTEHNHKGEVKLGEIDDSPETLKEVARILKAAGAFSDSLLEVGPEEGSKPTTH